MRSERGAVLAQVLIFAVTAGLLCASILSARLQPALLSARGSDRVRDDLAAQGAVNRVTGVWTRLGVCASDTSAGVSCGGSGCECNCGVTVAGETTIVTSTTAGGACALTAARQ